ncbi:MAG: hypothetical protein EP349_02305 [Alphaproteobacteria bacterium]|nr:MAG: hypothetical protein EP349_02305 [Alphaproteobacteria bacterium]
MLHHIEIYVSDFEKTAAFWGWLLEEELGYVPHQSWNNGAFDCGKSWRNGAHYLVFVQTREKYLEDGYNRVRTGLNHLAFYGRDKAHIDGLTEKLRKRGVALLYQEKYPHAGGGDTYAVYFEDPDRIKVEIVVPENSGNEKIRKD